jgi:hypothetical protein
MRTRRSPKSVLQGAAVVALLFLTATLVASAKEPNPTEGPSPREKIGGFISAPGVPFPVTQEALESAIPIQEAMIKVLRLVPGVEGPPLARSLGFLAGLYGAKGDFT